MKNRNEKLREKLQENVCKCLDYLIDRAKTINDEYKGFDVPWKNGYVNVWKNSHLNPKLVKITFTKGGYRDYKREEIKYLDENECCDFLEGWEKMKNDFNKMIMENDMKNERVKRLAEDFHV